MGIAREPDSDITRVKDEIRVAIEHARKALELAEVRLLRSRQEGESVDAPKKSDPSED